MKQKRSVVVEWVYSYILILLIPVITIFVNYYYNTKVIKDEIIQANELVLHNLQQSMDDYLYNELRMYTYILISPEFFSLIANDEMNSNFYADVMDTTNLITSYRGFESNISCMIYLKDKNYMIWEGHTNLSEISYAAWTFQTGNMPDYEQWQNMLAKEYQNEFWVTPYIKYNTREPCLVYEDTVAYEGYEPVNIFSYVPISEIEKLTSSLGDGMLLLIQWDEEIILALSNEGAIEITEEMRSISNRGQMFENDTYVDMQGSSEQNQVTYSLLIPNQEFWRQARHVRNVLLVSLIATLLIGGICVFFLINRNFQPISNLLVKTTGKRKKGNEFFLIESAFSSLESENKKMRSNILTQREILQRNYLLAVMKGKYAGIQKQTDYELYLRKDESVILVGYEVPMLDKNQLRHDDLLWFTIDNVFTELMEQKQMYRLEDGKYLFYLFIIKNSCASQWREKCLEKVNFLCDFLEDKWGTAVPAAISTSEHEIERIRFLYQDIMDAFEYKDVIGGSGIIDTETLKDTAPDTLSVKSAGILIEMALLKGDYSRMLALSKKLFDTSEQMPFLIFRMQVLEVFQVVAKFFDNHETADGQGIFLAGYLTPLLDASDKDSMKMIFDELLSYVYKSIYEQDNSKGIVADVREYVETHYTDSSLNISSIADAIGKKPRHISRVFKEETQEGILDYINDLRISKARLLLRTEKYTLEEISDMVGYASYKTFRRIFVKLTGVTPGRYGGRQSDSSMEE